MTDFVSVRGPAPENEIFEDVMDCNGPSIDGKANTHQFWVQHENTSSEKLKIKHAILSCIFKLHF